MEDLFYSIADCAKIMRCSKSLIYSMAKTGEIPVFKLGKQRKRVLIPVAEFKAMIAKQIKDYRESAQNLEKNILENNG